MAEIIRPRFGGKPSAVAQSDDKLVVDEFVRGFGEAAGYHVTLIRDATGAQGDTLKVIIGPVGGGTADVVAIVPATPIGQNDAGMIAMAILRTLEVIRRS